MKLFALVCIGLVTCAAAPAMAETTWFERDARAVPLGLSASRDAPVFELAYGPRAYGSLGIAPAIVRSGKKNDGLRLGFSGVFAWESDDESGAHSLLYRDLETLSLALAKPDVFAPGSTFELTTLLGHEGAHADRDAVLDGYRTSDIPFGAGGWFLGIDLGLRLRPSQRFSFVSRLGERLYVNAFPLWVGEREISDRAASALGEGTIHAPFFALEVRHRTTRSVHAVVSVWGEAFVAHDDSARDAVLLRALLGAAIPGKTWEFVPFLSGEAGNGKGYFVNRRELRTSLGLRLVLGGGEE
jgi:hypothetical protein